MPNSETDKYLSSVTFTPAVVGFLRDGDWIWLGVRQRVSGGLGQDLIAGIGGKVGDTPENKDETIEKAIDREVDEEIGVKVIEKQDMGRVRFIFTHKAPDSSWNQDVRIFSISKWEGEPQPTESTKPVKFPINEIPWDEMWEDNQHWLPKVLAGQKVDATFLFSGDNKIAEYRFDKAS